MSAKKQTKTSKKPNTKSNDKNHYKSKTGFLPLRRKRKDGYIPEVAKYPEIFELVLGENFLTTQLGPKQSITFSYIVRIPIRGRFLIGPTKIILHDRIGFFYEEDIREFYTEVLVYPSYQDIRRMEALSKKRNS